MKRFLDFLAWSVVTLVVWTILIAIFGKLFIWLISIDPVKLGWSLVVVVTLWAIWAILEWSFKRAYKTLG